MISLKEHNKLLSVPLMVQAWEMEDKKEENEYEYE